MRNLIRWLWACFTSVLRWTSHRLRELCAFVGDTWRMPISVVLLVGVLVLTLTKSYLYIDRRAQELVYALSDVEDQGQEQRDELRDLQASMLELLRVLQAASFEQHHSLFELRTRVEALEKR